MDSPACRQQHASITCALGHEPHCNHAESDCTEWQVYADLERGWCVQRCQLALERLAALVFGRLDGSSLCLRDHAWTRSDRRLNVSNANLLSNTQRTAAALKTVPHTDFVAGLHKPPDVHMDAVHWHAGCQEVSVLITENVADLRRDRCIVSKKAELVPNLQKDSIIRPCSAPCPHSSLG